MIASLKLKPSNRSSGVCSASLWINREPVFGDVRISSTHSCVIREGDVIKVRRTSWHTWTDVKVGLIENNTLFTTPVEPQRKSVFANSPIAR